MVKITHKFTGQHNSKWATTEHTVDIGYVDFVVNVWAVQMLTEDETAIYPTFALVFQYEHNDAPLANPIVDALANSVYKLTKADEWTTMDYKYEVYLYFRAYNNNDVVDAVKTNLETLGYVHNSLFRTYNSTKVTLNL